ncbi:class II aldolase/adducin family protein [Rhodobacteraceae bacterium nBUS_24]
MSYRSRSCGCCAHHSIATIAHVISPEGREVAKKKLAGLPFVLVPYAKPGLPLTQEILARVTPATQVILLQNHGLICVGATVAEVSYRCCQTNRLKHQKPEGVNSMNDKSAPPSNSSIAV